MRYCKFSLLKRECKDIVVRMSFFVKYNGVGLATHTNAHDAKKKKKKNNNNNIKKIYTHTII